MESNLIPKDILPYVTEISERLWTGHASVMIGAGFSKNAIPKDSTTKSLPTWYELGDIFYEKIHGDKPQNNIAYLNPLRLAEEVQAAFGRPVLNQLLKNSIVDKDFDVSELHINLMELPWSDIFTTNYDTLLERTTEYVINRRFDIIVNQEDIIYSNRPRIVKLHGSFPSERPLIITDEDYRTYPRKFAPFVNTVQQSLLENTLCLIGFSGEDPNFLQWIGWISDNIGKENSPKIYLIGVLNLTDAQKKLLASKNIVPIDLFTWGGGNGDHKIALSLFLKFLHEQRNKRENLVWPSNFENLSINTNQSVPEIIDNWSLVRKAYPEWVILPQEQRETLWSQVNKYYYDDKIFEKLDVETDINYSFELIWRCDKCLRTYLPHIALKIQSVVDRYSPYETKQSIKAEIDINNIKFSNLDWKQLRIKWTSISISLLRYYREQGLNDEWNKLNDILDPYKEDFAPELRASFFYERTLQAIFDANINLARIQLKKWSSNESLPFWDAKRAGLLFELGEEFEAIKILETALLRVRKRLNLSPIGEEYGGVSQEAYIMFLLRFIKLSFRTSKGDYSPDSSQSEFQERWINNSQYKCDPWAEKKFFDQRLAKYKTEETFELNLVNSSLRFQIDARDRTIAFSFFRFIEEIGMPLSINVSMGMETIHGALDLITRSSPSHAIGIINRLYDVKAINVTLSRAFLHSITTDNSNELLRFYLEKFNEFYSDTNKCSLTSAFIRKIPGIFSRLCVKSSIEMKIKLFEFAHKIYNNDEGLPQFGKFIKNLLSCSNSEVIYKVIPLLIDTPILSENDKYVHDFIDPFNNLPFITEFKPKININKEEIKKLYTLCEDANYRESAIKRLIYLYNNKLLNSAQSKKLAKAIWKMRDQNTGLPAKTNYYKWYFMKLPHLEDINVEELYKKYILENTFLIQSLNNKEGISITYGEDTYAAELIAGSFTINNDDGIRWTSNELDELIDKCENWFNLDNTFLKEEKYKTNENHSIYREFYLRFRNISIILSRVIGYQKNSLSSNSIKKIKRLILNLQEFKIPVMKVKVMFSKELSYSVDEYLDDLQESLANEERILILDGLESAIFTIIFKNYSKSENFENRLLDLLTQPLRWKNHNLMGDCLDTIREIINSKKDIPKPIEKTLLNTLEYIKDIKYDDIPLWQNNSDYLLLRQKAIMLGKKLYDYYYLKGNIPQTIKDWENIAKDPNEFGDVTVYWDSES